MSRRPIRFVTAALLLVALSACSDSEGPTVTSTTTTPATTTAPVTDFTLATRPEFVNRIIPGRRPVALVTATATGTESITFAATAEPEGVTVEFVPTSVSPGGTAEIWAVIPEVSSDVPVTITVTATRGGFAHTVAIPCTAIPGVDDLAPTALQIAQVFLDAMADKVNGLTTDAHDLRNGTPTAGLLVVSHYAWFTDEYEVGLAWHIMVAPQDWAELYIRPRSAPAPTRAFRLTSWSTALADGSYEIVEIAPPPDVTR